MTKKPKSKIDKRIVKQQQLVARVSSLLKADQAEVQALLSTPLQQAVRINPLKQDPSVTLDVMQKLGWQGSSIDWCTNGYTIDSGFEMLRDSDLARDGFVYIQNTSSWLPVVALDPQPGETVLDVCAAPGGKTSHIAALMQNAGTLIANDNSKPRLMRLQRNLERLSATAELTLHDATLLARKLDGQLFDRILLDAPCSGEGLINLSDPSTLDTWSVAHVKRLATLQKRIISQAWQLLKPGGVLVYSTCTTAPEENEAVINWLLRKQPDARLHPILLHNTDLKSGITEWQGIKYHADLSGAARILPNTDGDEAFFVAHLVKDASVTTES